jgi:PDZ domain-containing protein
VTDQPLGPASSIQYPGFAEPEYPAPTPMEPRTAVMLIAAFSAVLIGALVMLLPVKYAIENPGPVLNTLGKADGKSLIAISGHPTYPTSGQLDLTTVSLVGGPDRPVTLLAVVKGWLSHSSAVVPEEEIFAPGQTQQQSDAENQAEMVSSQESATAAALSTLGIAVPTTLSVAGTDAGSPAASVLLKGDVITSVNGTKITDLAKLRTVLATTKAGGRVAVRVKRDGKFKTLITKTAAAEPDGHTVLGVYINPTFSFPFNVKIQIENIGGPSAGMMFALGIIDTLTPGDLTGGKHIAGTGTIDADGTVGAIGGIRQKLVGARRSGASYFLAPADNCNEVQGHVPGGLQVIKVSTLDQARTDVAAIASHQAAGLQSCG